MKRLLSATLAFALLSTAALAEDLAPEDRMNLWCGLAFAIVTADAPVDATPDQQLLIRRFAEGGEGLVALARERYLELGYAEASFEALVERVTADVMRQVNSVDAKPEYSFEDCSALLGL